MKFKCKKAYKLVYNDLLVKDTWYELKFDDRFNSYMLKFPDMKLEFSEDRHLYNYFYTKQELRKEKITKLLNGK